MKLPPAVTGGGEETRVRHQIGNTNSVPDGGGRAARAAWNDRPAVQRELDTLPAALAILEADLQDLTDTGRRWTERGVAVAARIKSTRARLAAAHARMLVIEGQS